MFYELLGIVLLFCTTAVVVTGLLRANSRPALAPSATAAIEAGDRWHAHATRLARSLERLLDDPMVACTIPDDQRAAMRAQVALFWSDVEGDTSPP
jgi:hypothetical protein